MRNRRPLFGIVAVVTGLLVGAWIASPAGVAPAVAQQTPANDTISERLAALEKALVRNPDSPRDTVLARLGAIEQLLQQQAKADGKQTDDAKKSVDAAAADQDKLDRRLKILEHNAQENARNELNDQLRDLKKDLAGFQQTIKELSERIRKVEQRI